MLLAVPSSAASVAARLKYKCAWCSQVNPIPPWTWMVSAAIRLNAAEAVACAMLAASAGSSDASLIAHTA